MRKLIETHQVHSIVCDNPSCDYIIKDDATDLDAEKLEKYIGVLCPNCGWDLLTELDYINFVNITKVINFINKWFSWITIFLPRSKKPVTGTISTHQKIKIELDERK